MSISDERLAEMVRKYEARPDDYVPAILCSEVVSISRELQSLRAAAKVRAIREGDGEVVAWQVRNIGHEPLTWGLVTDPDLVAYYRRHPERYELRGLVPVSEPIANWTECCNMSPETCDCVDPKHIHVNFASTPAATGGEKE